MLRSITLHQISLVRLSYAFLNVSLHQMHIFLCLYCFRSPTCCFTLIVCSLVCADCVTPSYLPLRQTEVADWSRMVFEVEEFVPSIAKCSQPFTIYNNHLYVYPRHLKYDSQKSFTKVKTMLNCPTHCPDFPI